VRNVPHVTVVAPRILRWLLNFWGNLCSLDVKDENAAFGLLWHIVTARAGRLLEPPGVPPLSVCSNNRFKDKDNFSLTTLGPNPRKPFQSKLLIVLFYVFVCTSATGCQPSCI